MSELNIEFVECVDQIMEMGYDISPRGLKCKELLGYQLRISNPRDRIVTLPSRDLKFRYLLAELFWYMSGDPQSATIARYAPFWKQIAADDGSVNSNYGYRLLGYAPATLIPYNQWEKVKRALVADRDTRQAMMHINLPYDYTRSTKDVPCTLNLQWFIRESKLVLIVTMRSNDIILGFCNDVFQFTMLQEMMLCELKQIELFSDLTLGEYIHESHSMHLYDTHYDMAKKCIHEDPMANEIIMQEMVYNDIIRQQLIAYEKVWREDYNCSPADIRQPLQYYRLPNYWKNLIDVCFGCAPRERLCK